MLFSNWQLKLFADPTLARRDFTIAWVIKMIYSLIFLFIFCDFYSDGKLYGDAANFMKDSALLNEYGRSHPVEFLKIMTGWGDSSAYFEDPILQKTNLWSYGENGDIMNDNRLIIRLNALIHFFSYGSVYVHALVMSALSFFGIILLYKSLNRFVANKKLFFYTLILFPSIGFWGSGITKEAILIFAIGLFSYGLFNWGKGQRKSGIIFVLISLYLLLLNKPHVGLIVIGISPLLIVGKLNNWARWVRIFFPIMMVLILVGFTYTPTQFNLMDKVSYKQKDLINMGKGGVFFVTDSTFCAFDYADLDHFKLFGSDSLRVLETSIGEAKLFGNHPFQPFTIVASSQAYAVYLIQPPSGSYIETDPINYSRWALVKSIPSIFFNTVIRPFPWDKGSSLKYMGFASNVLLIFMIIFTFFKLKPLQEKEKYIQLYLILTALLILLIIGWTTPIFGAIARYKMVVELLIIVLLFIRLKPLTYVKK